MRIPFNRPYTTGRELAYIQDAVATAHLSGNGPYSARCASALEHEMGSRRALLTHSCTGALEMAAILAGIGPGDEVIMPSFTFVSTANAVVLRGGVPVFVDIRGDTLNLDESLAEEAVTPRTRAIMPVHYAGVGCELDTLVEIAQRRGLMLIEDAAQALHSYYRDRPLGSFGDVAALSFHETKNVHCGEGGALLVNRAELVERAEIVHEKGTNRRRFLSGQIDKYSWIDVGSSFLLSDVNAAFLWAQLEHAREITEGRLSIWTAYHSGFAELESEGRLRRPIVPAHIRHNAHMYYLLLADLEDRDRFIQSVNRLGVHAIFHYVPLHSSDAGRRLGRAHGELSQTSAVSERLVRLPLWAGMSATEVDFVIDASRRALTRGIRRPRVRDHRPIGSQSEIPVSRRG